MTKDEFRLCIMQQFKTEGAAIRYLCVQPDMQNREDATHFRNLAKYTVKPFALNITLTKFLDAALKPCFNVLFEDVKVKDGKQLFRNPSLNDGDIAAYSHDYLMECIKYNGNKVTFSLNTFDLTMDNFEFSMREVNCLWTTTYDVATHKFVDGEKLKYSLARLNMKRGARRDYYLDYIFDRVNHDAFMSFLAANGISQEIQTRFSAMLLGVAINKEYSTMHQFISSIAGMK